MASINWAAEITEYLKLGPDATATRGALLASLGSAVQTAMENQIGRTLSAESYTEAYDGNGKPLLFLRHDPIISVASLTVNGEAVTVGNPNVPTYPPAPVVIYGSGLRYTTGQAFTPGYSNVIVTYTAGFAVPPDDIVQAGVSWASVLFKDRDRSGISSEGAGGQTTSFTREMPPFVKTVLARWTRWDRSC